MIINLHVDSKQPVSRTSQIIVRLRTVCDEIGELYQVDKIQSENYLIYEAAGNCQLLSYIREKYGVTVTPWKWEGNRVIGFGFDFEENAEFTKFLLS